MPRLELIYGIDHRRYEMRIFEGFLRIRPESYNLSEPVLTEIMINEKSTCAIAWYGMPTVRHDHEAPFPGEQELFFFPLAPPAIPEWEFMSPSEWCVRFIGTTEGLARSPFADSLQHLVQAIPPYEWFILLQPRNGYMIGLDNREMGRNLYPASVVLRATDQGALVRPAPYHWWS